MPGIHVRTLDKFDWIYREKEPLLTVPGSYWLCHKKSVYKFTFKYHRQSKDNKQFNYGKELMKVIRRIIKSQPRQGQQFGTQHLLVTYNHSSWTRQDKMFAILKFRQRTNATAFSRAFVLTVKIVSSKISYQSEAELDSDLIEYDVNNVLNKGSEIIKKKNYEETITSSQNIKPMSTTSDEACNISSECGLTCSEEIQYDTRTLFSSDIESNRCAKEASITFFSDIEDSPLVGERTLKKSNSPKTQHAINNNVDNLNEVQESIDMPYQYLIEREIERINSKNTDNLNVPSFIPKNSPEKPARDLRNESTVFRAKSISTSTIIDNATARSANITDLVMEGLMFTITQNQDSITVSEQKTKSEPDEVLENSEKAKTVEGSEHLINSSLFKLENLITKLEMSCQPQVTSQHEKDEKTIFRSSIFRKNDLTNSERVYKSVVKVKNGKDKNDVIINVLTNENKEQSTEQPNGSRPGRSPMYSLQTKKPVISSLKNSSNSTHDFHDCILQQFVHTNYMDSAVGIKNDMLSKHITNNIPMEQAINKIEKNEIVNFNSNIFENNLNTILDDWNTNDDEEEIIPEALQNHQSICSAIHNNNAISNQEDVSNLLMDDIESEKHPYSLNCNQLINKLHVPRVISNEAVKYDLSSLRTSKLPELYSGTIVNHQNNSESCKEINNSNGQKIFAKRRLYNQNSSTNNEEIAIEMWKFLQDMTYGVKIVLQRLSY